MKFDQRDLKKLRWPLLAFALLVGSAIALGLWSTADARQAASERNTAASRTGQIEARLRQVRTEEQEIKERTALFQSLEKSGLTGEEKRLDWIEQLRDLQRELRLPGMNYEFGPQTQLEKVNGAGYAYHSSPLKIQLRLLHEKDLLDFLQRLQQEAKALVIVRSCKVARQTATETGTTPLGAECEMDWLTLRRSSNGQ